MSYADTLPPPLPKYPEGDDPLWPYSWICSHMPSRGSSIDDWIEYYRWSWEAHVSVGKHHAADSDAHRIEVLKRLRTEGATTYP